MEIFFLILCTIVVPFTVWSIVDRYRRHKRGEVRAFDQVDAVLDGMVIAATIDDLMDD